jgi:uncharacterized protein (TIGR03437 family)
VRGGGQSTSSNFRPRHVLRFRNVKKNSEVLYAGGYARAVDGYQVNFRLPAGIPAGTASLQLTAAGIPGAAVAITTK